MSVYTTVGRDELAAWLEPLALGKLIDHAGIAAGMQNSNFFVTTASGRYVLTLFERHESTAELEFHLALQAHLAQAGLPCPRPVVGADGRLWRPLAGKPAALLSCLPGESIEVPTAAHCREVGRVLARMHLAVAGIEHAPPNPCGAPWRQRVGESLMPKLSPDEAVLLDDELKFQAAQDWSALPRGVVHADLFRDNVLWLGDQLSGLLDFYFSGEDVLLFDLAVAANDWCAESATVAELIAGYESVRPLTAAEVDAWLPVRRAAALRFWLLRLDVRHRPRTGQVVTIKNPDAFRRLLTRFRLAPEALPR
ncbi:MAG: homoserine kinase [Proteobacteria bacterium]|nr:homoserine kinase [Pseudomonadota bacterium]